MYHIAAFSCGTFYSVYYDARLGYYRTELVSGSCGNFKAANAYSGYTFTGVWKFGRFIAAVGAMLVWIVAIAVGAAAFVEYPHPAKRYISIIISGMGVIAFFSLLLLVGLSAGYTLGGAGYLAIVSAFVWTGAAVSMFYCVKERLPPPLAATDDSENPAMADEKLTSTNNVNVGVPVIPVAPMNSNIESIPVRYDPSIQFQKVPVVSVSEGAVNVQEYEDEFIGGDDAPSLVLPEGMEHPMEAPIVPVSAGAWNVQEYDNEVIEDAPSLVLPKEKEHRNDAPVAKVSAGAWNVPEYGDEVIEDAPSLALPKEKEHRIEVGEYEEEVFVDQDAPEIHCNAEPEGISVIQMDYEAEISAAPQAGTTRRGDRKPLEP
jgi:hypothetical protein